MATRVEMLNAAVATFEGLAKKALLAGGGRQDKKFLQDLATAAGQMKEKLVSCDRNAQAFETEDKGSAKALADTKLPGRVATQLQQFKASADAFKQLVTASITNLNNKIAEQKGMRGQIPPAFAKALEEVIRGLKVLKTGLDAIAKGNEQWHANSKTVADDIGQRADTMGNIAKNFLTSLRAEVAKGLAAAQRVKASPTAETYNDEMYKAGRNITQILNNIPKLTTAGKVLPPGIPANHAALAAALTPFGNGNLATVPAGATEATVLANIKQYNQAVKAVVAGFGL